MLDCCFFFFGGGGCCGGVNVVVGLFGVFFGGAGACVVLGDNYDDINQLFSLHGPLGWVYGILSAFICS